MKPYVAATGAILSDAPYMGGIGGGLTVHAKAGNVSLDPYAEIVQQNFRNSTFYPLATRFERHALDGGRTARSLPAFHGNRASLLPTPTTSPPSTAITVLPPTFGCPGSSPGAE